MGARQNKIFIIAIAVNVSTVTRSKAGIAWALMVQACIRVTWINGKLKSM